MWVVQAIKQVSMNIYLTKVEYDFLINLVQKSWDAV